MPRRIGCPVCSLVLAIAFLFAGVSSALAKPCDTASSAFEAVTCFDRQLGKADKHLNTVYKERRSELDDTGQQVLRDAQRAWITFRDAECLRIADSSRGGTDATI